MSDAFHPVIQQAMKASAAGDTTSAVRLLRQAISELPSDALPHFLLGAEFAQAGEIQDAEAAYANAVLLAPGFEIARFQLGLLQFTSGRAAMALVTWQPLAQLPNSHPLQQFVSAFAALAQDRLAEARELLRQGIAANDDNAPLNADMQLVVEKINQALANPNTAASQLQPVQGEPATHLLLSVYQQNGSVH